MLGDLSPKNFENEYLTVQPIFSPNNSLYEIKKLIDSANISVDVQNQYILKFDSYDEWLVDGNPLMQALVQAFQRGIQVRVILASEVDEDDAAGFLQSINMSVKYLGSPGVYCHNKGMIVDGRIAMVSSINWSWTSLTQNREAGLIVYSSNIAQYYESAFEYDWQNGLSVLPNGTGIPNYTPATVPPPNQQFQPITGYFNLTTFVNPDNQYAYELIVEDYFSNKTTFSLHSEMYSFSFSEIEKALSDSLASYPGLDMTIIMSWQRASSSGDTSEMESEIFSAGANLYLSNEAFTYTHAKYWMINELYSFIYSGNWAGTSMTPAYYGTYNYTANREWGIMIDNPCFAYYLQTQVFAIDLSISTVYSSPEHCTHYDKCGICNGNGTSCVPTPLFDSCGVCLGNNNQCPASTTASTTSSFATTSTNQQTFTIVFYCLFLGFLLINRVN